MPDLLTHILFAWIICTILGWKFKQFDGPYTAIVMIGSVIPDFYKIILPLQFLHINLRYIIAPLHLPVGSLVVAGILSLFFQNYKKVFVFLSFGITLHFMLDLLLINLVGGIYIFFPFNWDYWSLNVIPMADYNITILTIIIAMFTYIITRIKSNETFNII